MIEDEDKVLNKWRISIFHYHFPFLYVLLRQNPFHIYVPGTVNIRILVNKVSYVMLNLNIFFVPSYEHMLLVTIGILI